MTFDASPIWISLKTAFAATFITFFLGIAAARAMLAYRGKAKGLIDGVLLLPLVLPPTVVGFLLLLLFGRNGPLGRFLLHLGVSVVFSWPATVITATVVAFPLMYKTAAGAFEQIDENILHAARTLGASEFTVLRRVMLPLAWPGVMAGASLAFARALGEFGATLMLAGNIPGRTQTLPVAIFFGVESGEWVSAALWTLVVVSIALVVIAAISYWSRFERPPGAFVPRASDVSLESFDALASEVSFAPSRSTGRPTQGSALQPRGSSPQARDQQEFPGALAPAFPAPPAPEARAGLAVDVEKKLPGFTLKVAFTAGVARLYPTPIFPAGPPSDDGNGLPGPLGIIGASGSGKTMTLRAIAGLERPQRGRVVLNGRVLFDSASGVNLPSRQRRIGLVFQNYALFPHLSVAENVAFGLTFGSERLAPSEREARAARVIEQVRLRGLEGRLPRQLSGGQQQRVALARALAIQPEAILLDEPLSALDTYLQSQVETQLMEVLRDYSGVVLYVTHNLEEAYRISRSLLVLAEGKSVAGGRKEEVFRRPPTYAVARVTGCKNFSRARALADGRVEATDWGVALRVAQALPASLAYVGIRAHHIVLSEAEPGEATLARHVGATKVAASDEWRVASDEQEKSSGAERNLNISSIARQNRSQIGRSDEWRVASGEKEKSSQHSKVQETSCTGGKDPPPAGEPDAAAPSENSFPCWLARAIETPFRVTLYLRLKAPPSGPGDYHLQAEVFKDKWTELRDRALPWRVRLEPERLFLMGK
jgi:molybdate transport system permease protein